MSAKIDAINSTANDGGLAFPGTRCEQVGMVSDYGFTDDGSPTFDVVHHPGMTLRDWFASQALIPFMSWALGQKVFEDYDTAAKAAARYAKSSYLVADAMIAARKADAE